MPSPSHSDSVKEGPLQLLRVLRTNPTVLALVTILYLFAGVVFFAYYQARQQAAESRRIVERLQDEIKESLVSQRFLVERSNGAMIDIFRPLSFTESSAQQDQEKLRAALSLNSFAKYAIANRDLSKARETLDESLKAFPTLEAQYYSGVTYYLQGDNEQALGFWKPLEGSAGVPDDIYLYLSLAEYRSGNTQAAKRYSEMYSRHATAR